MTQPYRTMIRLFAVLGALAAIDAALASLGVTSFLMGLRWLRVHLVTIGIFTEAAFGLLPGLVALRAGRPAPPPRNDRWLLLNVGLVTLLVGIPLVRAPMIGVGGTLVLLAAVWLGVDLWRIAPDVQDPGTAGATDSTTPGMNGRWYYLAALSFLTVGALVGTGLWLGWGDGLRIAVPKETHVHAMVWGFTSLVLAGVLADLPLPPAFALVERADASAGAASEALGPERRTLGGRWTSWAGANLCALALVASVPLAAYEARLHAAAFGLLAAVLLGWVWDWTRSA